MRETLVGAFLYIKREMKGKWNFLLYQQGKVQQKHEMKSIYGLYEYLLF